MKLSDFQLAWRILAAGFILYAVLILPNHPAALAWGNHRLLPLEWPVLFLMFLALVPGRLSQFLRWSICGVLLLFSVLKVADFVSYNALSRSFNPLADLFLVEAFVRLLIGTIGLGLTLLAGLAVAIGLGVVVWLLWWATGTLTRVAMPSWLSRSATLAAAGFAVLAAADIGERMEAWDLPFRLSATAATTRIGTERLVLARDTWIDLQTFNQAARSDPFEARTDLFAAIDRDVLIFFVESYGRTSLDTPLFAETHRATLARFEAALLDQGVAIQSGILTSPTQGGQSWLSHATFSNGLWVSNQVSYGAILSSGRSTLYHHASRAGLDTAVVMPQITLEWPEADRMGFETILVAEDLGYEGLNFNWVTMPDQFTLSALDRLLREDRDGPPLFAQVALVSSHAPWVPVPEIVPWENIGDGTIFNDMAASGDPPEVVWRDRDRVRDQYRLAIDYALQAVFEYALLHADNPPLILVIGDHQAAGFIALDERAEVPIHVLGPAHLVSSLSDLAPDPGLLPSDDRTAFPMEAARDVILEAFSQASEAVLSQ